MLTRPDDGVGDAAGLERLLGLALPVQDAAKEVEDGGGEAHLARAQRRHQHKLLHAGRGGRVDQRHCVLKVHLRGGGGQAPQGQAVVQRGMRRPTLPPHRPGRGTTRCTPAALRMASMRRAAAWAAAAAAPCPPLRRAAPPAAWYPRRQPPPWPPLPQMKPPPKKEQARERTFLGSPRLSACVSAAPSALTTLRALPMAALMLSALL